MSKEMQSALEQARLYGIIDLGYVTHHNAKEVSLKLLQGGVDLLQLRAKQSTPEEIHCIAQELVQLCKLHHTPFIINDYPDIAKSVGADGLHLGQDDGSLLEAREIVGETMLIGRSTHSITQAKKAQEEGFDYIGFGPLFETPTKQGRAGIGLENIKEVMQCVSIPTFCIGGIKPNNLNTVIDAGAKRVVIVSALLQASDVVSSTKEVKATLKELNL